MICCGVFVGASVAGGLKAPAPMRPEGRAPGHPQPLPAALLPNATKYAKTAYDKRLPRRLNSMGRRALHFKKASGEV